MYMFYRLLCKLSAHVVYKYLEHNATVTCIDLLLASVLNTELKLSPPHARSLL